MTAISKTPGVCGGAACVGSGRVPGWIIVLMSEAGAGHREMVGAYPDLTPVDCAAALNYALKHAPRSTRTSPGIALVSDLMRSAGR
jgi:uncharacterized protein (DUF433 family)